jgi:hypothetical protein
MIVGGTIHLKVTPMTDVTRILSALGGIGLHAPPNRRKLRIPPFPEQVALPRILDGLRWVSFAIKSSGERTYALRIALGMGSKLSQEPRFAHFFWKIPIPLLTLTITTVILHVLQM